MHQRVSEYPQIFMHARMYMNVHARMALELETMMVNVSTWTNVQLVTMIVSKTVSTLLAASPVTASMDTLALMVNTVSTLTNVYLLLTMTVMHQPTVLTAPAAMNANARAIQLATASTATRVSMASML